MTFLRHKPLGTFFDHVIFYITYENVIPRIDALFSFVTLIIRQKMSVSVSLDLSQTKAAILHIKVYAQQQANTTIFFSQKKQKEESLEIMLVTIVTEDLARVLYQFELYNLASLKKEVVARPQGNKSSIEIFGTYIAIAGSKLRCNTHQYHDYPNAHSSVLVQGISIQQSSVIHHGFIYIAPNGRGTKTHQSSKHLTLSKEVYVNAQPILDIRNNQISCAHASAIGTISNESLFYLAARGINKRDAILLTIQSYVCTKIPKQIEHENFSQMRHILHLAIQKIYT